MDDKISFFRVLLFLSCFSIFTFTAEAELPWTFGVISASAGHSNAQHEMFCIAYVDEFQSLPEDKEKAASLELADVTSYDLCEDSAWNLTDLLEGKAAAVSLLDKNCSLCDVAHTVQKHGGNATLLIQEPGQEKYPCGNDTEEQAAEELGINITVARMLDTHFTTIAEMGEEVRVRFYAPVVPRWDYSLIFIWVVATATVAMGAFWAGLVIHQARKKKAAAGPAVEDEEAMEISPLCIVILVVMMVSMLLLLYFFYDALVYVIIAMFTLACSISLYGCLFPLYMRLPCLGDCRLPANKIPVLKRRPQIKCVLLAVACAAVGITWAVFRNAQYAWIVQDILGVTFCVQLMKTIRLPNLMACTILLGLLFVYDIFFVFITPLFMPDGDSIMVHVATGGKSKEMLPMVVKVPHVGSDIDVCSAFHYSLLGFGDILVPGLLVSYCHGFDLKVGGGRIYYIASLIAYGVGMVLTFVALVVMEVGQPALLYLVPCTLFTTYIIALCRRQFKHMWHGHLETKKNSDEDKTITSRGHSSRPVNQTSSHTSPVHRGADSASSLNSHASDTSDEEATLLVNQS